MFSRAYFHLWIFFGEMSIQVFSLFLNWLVGFLTAEFCEFFVHSRSWMCCLEICFPHLDTFHPLHMDCPPTEAFTNQPLPLLRSDVRTLHLDNIPKILSYGFL